ncbi:MAG: dipeptidyl-peptidase 3 family protein [Candidatus Kapaibacteriales bacterium]
MKNMLILMGIFSILFAFTKQEVKDLEQMRDLPSTQEMISEFAPVHIKADLSFLSERERKVLKLLVEAGKIADEIFWEQNSLDGLAIKDSLSKMQTKEAKDLLHLVNIFYGPYSQVYDNRRFVGNGPEVKPKGANFYPIDLEPSEFERYVAEHPDQKDELESQYTIVVRVKGKLKAIPYSKAYPKIEKMAIKLEESASYCDDENLRKYLLLRAKALRTDDYFESDLAWMNVKNSNIDVVIGPIENYQDEMFNYKTAFEAMVMVKDIEGSKMLETFQNNIDYFESNLPYDKKYIRKSAGTGNILQVMNIIYFGGDCQAGTKTIANSLPNDPRVHELKGGKKTMFKNVMEAKFDKILVPIAREILDPSLLSKLNKESFISFVTLHEVSHTLGRGFVYGNDSLSVRKALKDKYSAIEECKADVLGLYNHKHLFDKGLISKEFLEKTIITYVAGFFRSIRFGSESAHAKANLIQLNYLKEKGLIRVVDGKITFDINKVLSGIEELAMIVLTIQAEGNYDEATKLVDKYARFDNETIKLLKRINKVPRDLDTSYDF